MDDVSFPEGNAEEDDPKREGILSIVLDGADRGIRKLPSLYVGPGLVFTDRDIERVKDRLVTMVEVLLARSSERIYSFTACKVGDSFGLYGRDFFDRAAFRRKLARRGFSFSTDPFTRFLSGGLFQSRDWGDFRPDFVILAAEPASASEVVELSGSLFLYALTSYRFGVVTSIEFRELRELASRVRGLGALDASVLSDALSAP